MCATIIVGKMKWVVHWAKRNPQSR